MVALKLNGKPTDCPTSYDELNTETYQRIFKEWDLQKELHERDFFKLFCILTGSPFTQVDQSPENEAAIWELTRWVIEQNYTFTEAPEYIEIEGKKLSIPENIGSLSIGQNIILKQLLEKSKYLEESISMAMAVYLQPIYHESKFNYQKALEIERVIKRMPIKDTYQVGFFLLSRALKDGQKHSSNWHLIQKHLSKKLKRMWPKWLRSIGSKDLVISQSLTNTQ